MKRFLILIASTIMILTLVSCSDMMGLNKTVEVNTIPNTTVNKRTFPVVSDVYDTVNNTKYNTQTKATESSTNVKPLLCVELFFIFTRHLLSSLL